MKQDSPPVFLPSYLIGYSDSDFTNPHEAMLPEEPRDCRGKFTHMGAQYWGFESRRHRNTTVLPNEQALGYDHNAYDWMVIGLKRRSEISVIRISTKWYTGNQVRSVTVFLKDDVTKQKKRVLERQPLNPDAEHEFPIDPTIATECLIECYYDGGISRVNFFGKEADQPPERRNLLQGTKITHVSNEHYGKPDVTVTGERQQMHMVGWESARTGFGEQALFHLNKPAEIDEIVIDTYLHRLNSPLTAHIFAANGADADAMMKLSPRWKLVFGFRREVIPDDFRAYMMEKRYLQEKFLRDKTRFKIKLHIPSGSPWKPLLSFVPLSRDTYHRLRKLNKCGSVTHVLYIHYPNGGIHGLKMFGTESG
jgi:allantoicase